MPSIVLLDEPNAAVTEAHIAAAGVGAVGKWIRPFDRPTLAPVDVGRGPMFDERPAGAVGSALAGRARPTVQPLLHTADPPMNDVKLAMGLAQLVGRPFE